MQLLAHDGGMIADMIPPIWSAPTQPHLMTCREYLWVNILNGLEEGVVWRIFDVASLTLLRYS